MKAKEILIVAAVLALPLTVFAADSQSDSDSLFKKLDTNHDGYISKEEAQAYELLKKNWDKADVNNRGMIDSADFSAFEEATEPGPIPPENDE